MERRLKLARKLLNPNNSVLIVTIDEKEYLRLGLLLEQTFPEARIQMISDQVNPANVARRGAFGRSDEYVFFVMIGHATPQRVVLGPDWVSTRGRTFNGQVRWDLLRRSGTNALRSDRPKLFYPVFVDPARNAAVGAGEPIGLNEHADEAETLTGMVAVWPIRKDGTDGNWQLGPAALRRHIEQGRVRLGGSAERGYVVYYIKGGEYEKVLRGTIRARSPPGRLAEPWGVGSGRESSGRERSGESRPTCHPIRISVARVADSRTGFSFPKSLYSVEDALGSSSMENLTRSSLTSSPVLGLQLMR